MYFQSRKKNKMKQVQTGQVGPKKEKMEMAEDAPSKYEGKEHVKYKNPGFSKHEIRIPEDEPKMRSRVSKEESHEMEDNYHMDVPDQTPKTLEKNIKRAFMKMDQPDEEGPKPMYGNLVTKVSEKGLKDEDGWENYGPEKMQEDSDEKNSPSKARRKKIAIAVIRRKMHKNK